MAALVTKTSRWLCIRRPRARPLCRYRHQLEQLRIMFLLRMLTPTSIVIIIMLSTIPCECFAPPLLSRAHYNSYSSTSRGQRRMNDSCVLVLLHAKKRHKKVASSGGDEEMKHNNDKALQQYPKVNSVVDDTKLLDENNMNKNQLGVDNDISPKPKRTISGGPSLIFEMARRMLVWDDELYESGILNDAGSRRSDGTTSSPSRPRSTTLETLSSSAMPSSGLSPLSKDVVSTPPLPRWRPLAIRQQSISNVNPEFRTSSPIMTNAGYAGILRRNSRKKNMPSMWRHCLRIYNKMGELERNGDIDTGGNSSIERRENDNLNYLSSSSISNTFNQSRRAIKIRRSVAHHEAALVAASKLGMWEEAILIFQRVESSLPNNGTAVVVSTGSNNQTFRKGVDCITDNMILSVISACVKGSKVKQVVSSNTQFGNSDINGSRFVDSIDGPLPNNILPSNETRPVLSSPQFRVLTIDERRRPLDAARHILLTMEDRFDIPLVSRHINPLASAYNRLGLCSDASALINQHLNDRIPPPPLTRKKQNPVTSTEPRMMKEETKAVSDNLSFVGVPLVEWNDDCLKYGDDIETSLLSEDDDMNGDDDFIEEEQLNIHELKSKDHASYALLVQGAAIKADWTSAVRELQRMTDAGFHPNSRDLNRWNEVMEKGYRPAGSKSTNAKLNKKRE